MEVDCPSLESHVLIGSLSEEVILDRQLGVMGNSTDVVHLCVFHPFH